MILSVVYPYIISHIQNFSISFCKFYMSARRTDKFMSVKSRKNMISYIQEDRESKHERIIYDK